MQKYMRLERQWRSEPGAHCVPYPLRQSLFMAFWLAAGACLLLSSPARAMGETLIDGEAGTMGTGGKSMPNSNPRVQSILAAHPNQFVVICVAGCDGKPKAVQILPRPVKGRTGAFVPSAAKIGREPYGPPLPGQGTVKTATESDDVVCMAGCLGRPGQIVQRIPGLPPPTAGRPRTPKDVLPKKRDEKRNEPLE